ncbi:MAG TPA: flagellar hook-associated protein FlgK [Woeseiaceae bacterium]|nr:flagellar hook-associated protein FlgK [Woeseiaceae bacterium]
MPDLLNISLSGMLAFRRAIEMTGHNIANANTPGYSRQVAEFATRHGQSFGNGYIGGGTDITTIKRVFDEFAAGQLRASLTGQARFATLDALARRLDNLLAGPETGLDARLQTFFNAVQDVANDPASTPARQALLGEADSLVQRFRSLEAQLDALEQEVSSRIGDAVARVNQLASAIADVNDKIVAARNGTGQPPNDLLDERDRLVQELSGQLAVSVVPQDDGSLSVFMASGLALVVGGEASGLAVRGSEFDPTRPEVAWRGPAGEAPLGGVSGGTLGGLLDFRAQFLDPAREALGETALALVTRFNAQHAAGMTPDGTLGGDFFRITPPAVWPSSRNAGSAGASVTVTDVGALPGGDLVLSFDGTDWQLAPAGGGAAIPLSGSGTAGDPFTAAGLAIEVSGTPAAGDRLLIRPAAGAAGGVSVVARDPQDIAMAAPLRATAALGNTGTATITPPEVTDPDDPDLLAGFVIEFTSATSYTVDGSGPFAWTSGQPITVNGVTFAIEGTPAAGDVFTVQANTGATGDNRNALALAGLQSAGILDGGTVSIGDRYGQLVAAVGSATHQVRANLDAHNVMLASAEDQHLSISGVNLDEEAANLLRFQQAYQASAQVVSVARTLFDTLLAATGRR